MAEKRVRAQRAAILLGALALDLTLGEPSNSWHPVAWSGRLLEAGHRPLRRRRPPWQLLGGAAVVGGLALAAASAGRRIEHRLATPRSWTWPLLAVALKPTFSVRQLVAVAGRVARALDEKDLARARGELGGLVSRPTQSLPPPLIASAAIESLAENLADSVAAPWLYYAIFGLPGAVAYRVVNTADAMYGYRGEMEWLGKAAALADDLLSWLPSRLAAAALVAAAAVLRGGHTARAALWTWSHDAAATSSPNAGRPMAAMAGALERRLEKTGHYVLGGSYGQPESADIRRAAQLVMGATGLLALSAAAVLALRAWIGMGCESEKRRSRMIRAPWQR